MNERPTQPKLMPVWGWWLLFGFNAILALYWATVGDIPLLAVINAFVAGMAIVMSSFAPKLADLARRSVELEHEFVQLSQRAKELVERLDGNDAGSFHKE
jgi:hypothetical protein